MAAMSPGHLFLVVFFHFTHNRLSEWWTTSDVVYSIQYIMKKPPIYSITKKNLFSLKSTNGYRQTKTVQFLQHSPVSLIVISNLSHNGFTNLSICQRWTKRHNPDITLNLWRDVSHTRTDHFHNGLKHKRRKTVKRASVFRFCLGTKGKSAGVIK